MSAVRTVVSIASLLAAVMASAGCYDLSDPTGPHRDDFMRDRTSATEPAEQEQGKATAEVRCAKAPCNGTSDMIGLLELAPPTDTSEAEDDGDDDDRNAIAARKVRVFPPESP